MRRFVILGHTVPLHADFHLNDLPGGAGRIDILCRAVGASLLLSHGIRRDVEVALVLQNEVRIRIPGDRVKRLNPDERSTAALLRRAIAAAAAEELAGAREIESTPGVFASRTDLSRTLDELRNDGSTPIVLDENGVPLESIALPEDPAFILSDHNDFSDEDEATLESLPRVSLGSVRLHTSQAITIMHHVLDRRDEDTQDDLVLAHKVWGEPKAQMIRGLLEDFEIPVNLVSHAPPSIYPMVLDGLAEVRIMVRPRDLAQAQQVIADYFEAPCEE